MKNKLLVILCCIATLSSTAQKIIEKHLGYTGKKLISMNFQISDSIRIITWNKNEVYIKSSINVNENKNNEDYKMSFGESDDNINISGKLDYDKVRGSRNGDNNCNCCRSEIYHDVFIPENADISIETINGNITITGTIAGIRAHTISGFIDLAVPLQRKADLKLNTITGNMYSDLDLQTESGKMKRVGGGTPSMTTRLNGGGGKPIDLETISGNIFLRKAG